MPSRIISFKSISYIALLIFSVIGVYLRLEAFDVIYINNWITSDFDRAFNLVDGEYIPLAGPDMSNGRRLPGPFLYFLLAIPVLIHHSYESIFAFNLISNITSIIGFYWVVNRFFGFKVALVSVLLLLVNIPHIGAAGFPKNAAFIFPLVPIFLYLIFEFSINRKTKFLPWIILVVSLGFQISYSFATFYLVPLIICWALGQKIPFKTLLLSALVALICFTPYFMYKQKTFITNQEGIRIVRGLGEYSTLGLLRVPVIDHTIERVTFRNGVSRYHSFPKEIGRLYYLLTTISLWGLFLYGMIQSRRGMDVQKYRKEIVVLILFYVPALIYEIVAPRPNLTNPHHWYTWIFIMPQLLMISLALNLFVESCQKKLIKVCSFATVSLALIFITTSAFADIGKLNEFIEGEGTWSYKKTRIFYQALMRQLKVTPKQLMSNFYFDETPTFSKFFLNDFYEKLKPFSKEKIEQDLNNDCIFMTDLQNIRGGTFQGHRFNLFLSDSSIKKYSPMVFTFSKNSRPKSLMMLTYKPLLKQPCYRNLFSRFALDKDDLDLLSRSKKFNSILGGYNNMGSEMLLEKESYDSKSRLKLFETKLYASTVFLRAPIGFNVFLKRTSDRYTLKTEVQQYHYYPYRKTIQGVSIKICPRKIISPDCFNFEVLPKESLANTLLRNNKFWFREISLPLSIQFIKNRFFIHLTWSETKIGKDGYGSYSKVIGYSSILLNPTSK